jgi:hypothetical protein
MKPMKTTRHLLTLLLLAPLIACAGGGGDDSSNPLGGGSGSSSSGSGDDAVNDVLPSTTLSVTFVADVGVTSDGMVWMAESEADAEYVTIKVNTRGTDDVYSAGFDVDYSSADAEFVNWSPGNLLERNEHDVIYQVSEQPGKVIVGASRVSSAPGADIGGPKTIIYLTFRSLRPGSTSVSFDNASLLRPATGGPETIEGLTWLGGRFDAN